MSALVLLLQLGSLNLLLSNLFRSGLFGRGSLLSMSALVLLLQLGSLLHCELFLSSHWYLCSLSSHGLQGGISPGLGSFLCGRQPLAFGLELIFLLLLSLLLRRSFLLLPLLGSNCRRHPLPSP